MMYGTAAWKITIATEQGPLQYQHVVRWNVGESGQLWIQLGPVDLHDNPTEICVWASGQWHFYRAERA